MRTLDLIFTSFCFLSDYPANLNTFFRTFQTKPYFYLISRRSLNLQHARWLDKAQNGQVLSMLSIGSTGSDATCLS